MTNALRVWHCGCDIQLQTSATTEARYDGRRSHLLGPRSTTLQLPPVYTGRFTIDRCPMPAKKVRRSARNADVKGSSAKMNASEEQRKGGRRRKLRSLDDIVKMPTDIMREVSSATVLGCSGTTDKRPSSCLIPVPSIITVRRSPEHSICFSPCYDVVTYITILDSLLQMHASEALL